MTQNWYFPPLPDLENELTLEYLWILSPGYLFAVIHHLDSVFMYIENNRHKLTTSLQGVNSLLPLTGVISHSVHTRAHVW